MPPRTLDPVLLEQAMATARSIQTGLNSLADKGYANTDISQIPQNVDISRLPQASNPTTGRALQSPSIIGAQQSNPQGVEQFNLAIQNLLKRQQQMGTKGFATQGFNAEEEQIKRAQTTPSNLIGANPNLQNSVRNASISAVQPTVSSAAQSQQTFGEQIRGFGDVIENARRFSKEYEDRQTASRDEAKQNILLAMQLGGAEGLNAIKRENPNIFKIAGLDEATIIEAARAKEAFEKESKKTFSTVDLGDRVGVYDNQGNLVRTDSKGITPGSTGVGALTAGQKESVTDGELLILQANQALNLGREINWAGVGGLGAGSISQFAAKNFGTGTSKEQDLRNLIGNIKGTIAKLRGGTSFTVHEQRLLDSYVPGINDDPLVIESKLRSLVTMIQQKNNILRGGTPTTTGANDPLGVR